MLESHLLDDLGRLKAAALSEDEGVAYQSIGAVGAMTMSYMVTVVHLCSLGELHLDVIDSRSGKDSLSSIKEELEHDGREVQSRLVIAEDLPRDTYDLLQHTIGVDARLLDDHRRNGHGSGFVGQADLDIDKAPRASSTSVAMPFDLQIGPEIFPTATGWRGDEYVEEEVNGILKHHQLVNYLRYDWQPFFIGRPLPALFYTTYRRLSYQNISGAIPTSTKYRFHVSADLRFPPNPRRDTELPSRPVARRSELVASRAGCSVRIRQLIDHLTNGVDSDDLSSNALSRSVQAWITINTYRSFEASVESSIRCWYNVKSYLKATSSGHVGKKRLCERFRQATLIKRHQMDKARTELEVHINAKSEPRTTIHSDVSHEDYTLQQWQRSQSSLQWVLDDVEDALRSNEGDLHMELTTLQIEESRKAIRQGAVVKRLTALAFVFIPISTVCSAFGMNLREFGKDLPPAWVFAAVALAVVTGTVICSLELSGNLFWAMLSLLNSWTAFWRGWWQDVYDNASTEEASFGFGVATIGVNLAGVKGVKPWLDPSRKKPMKTRFLRNLPMKAIACLALAPIWLTGAMILHIRRLEQRGRAFKAGGLHEVSYYH
ncbi:MAG: hypothetical protein Q9172_000567 [Xanthocarpia lactea]